MNTKRHRRCGFTIFVGLWAVLYVAVLAGTADTVGFTRDEGYYFKAAEQYAGYFRAAMEQGIASLWSRSAIDAHLGYNTEHPPLAKFLQALSYQLTSVWTGWFSPSLGHRFSGMLFAGLSVLATFWLGRAVYGAAVGALAAVALSLLPRYFFDAHLACFDVPITALWTLTLFMYLRAREKESLKSAVAAGGVFGLALATKLNALFLPVVILGAWLCARPAPRWRWRRDAAGPVDLMVPWPPRAVWVPALVGPLVFFCLWPYLWPAPLPRLNAYLAFHLGHEHYPALWFGKLLVRPPFPLSFPFVMTALTIPAPWVGLSGLGLIALGGRLWRARREAELVIFFGALLPMVLIALPSTPIFGGVKHWYNAMPALLVLGAERAVAVARFLGRGMDSARAGRGARGARLGAVALWLLLILGPGVLGIIDTHPHGIGAYNALAGGVRGAATLGLQRGFWGGLARPLYERHLSGDALRGRVFFNRTNYDGYRMYRREGIAGPGVYYSSSAKGAAAAASFIQPEHGEAEAEIWTELGPRPIDGVYLHEVPLVEWYARGASAQAPVAPPVPSTQTASVVGVAAPSP